MTTPTRQEIIDAHDALSSLAYLADNYISSTSGGGDEVRELRQAILKALPPRPRPTMAEIKWDDDKHYLAEAEHKVQDLVIMLSPGRGDGIKFFKKDQGYVFTSDPSLFTPTGKRYTLTEVQDG